MALKLTLDSLEAVPDSLRDHYKTGPDGRLTLDVEGLESPGIGDPAPDLVERQHALERRLIEIEATHAIATARGEAKLLLPHVLGRLRVAGAGEALTLDVLDEAGQPRRVPSGDDGAERAMTLAELVEEMRADSVFARAFEGSGRNGGGAPAQRGGGDGVRVISMHDQRAINAHVADIAAGRVRVVA